MQLPAFLLPAVLATFSLAFGIVWRRGSKPAFWWMIAYAAQGVAYLGEIVPTLFHQSIDTMLVDAIFVVGFLAFGQATCLYFGWPRRIAVSLCLATAISAVDAWQIFVADSLKGELLAVDLGLGALAATPYLFGLRRVPPSLIDRAMVAVTAATVLNCVVVSSLFAILGSANASFETYMGTGYVAASYAVTSFLNVVVPLIQLAAVALRVIADHREASEIDLLTSLLNRRGFDRACSDSRRLQQGVVVTCDIDRFKRINDGFGHAVGDRVIVKLAAAIRASLPGEGFGARFGGEEFVVVLPGLSIEEAVAYANTVASTFTVNVADGLSLPFAATASFGIAAVEALAATMHDDLKRADRALYAAKQAGRNRVAVEPDHGDPASAATAPAVPRALRIVA